MGLWSSVWNGMKDVVGKVGDDARKYVNGVINRVNFVGKVVNAIPFGEVLVNNNPAGRAAMDIVNSVGEAANLASELLPGQYDPNNTFDDDLDKLLGKRKQIST